MGLGAESESPSSITLPYAADGVSWMHWLKYHHNACLNSHCMSCYMCVLW
jgi:hypothetical protein